MSMLGQLNEKLLLPRLVLAQIRGVGAIIALLGLLTIVSALAVVWSAHKTRMARAQLEQMEAQRDKLDADYRAMKVAQSALGEHSRVEQVARDKLAMERVSAETERVVNP